MSYFTPLVGQKQAVELLSSAIENKRIAPAYIFSGRVGVGRSLAASCFSEMLLLENVERSLIPTKQKKIRRGNHPDLLWVMPSYMDRGKIVSIVDAVAKNIKCKAPPQIRIEQIREITQFVSRPPLEATRSLIIIEAAQLMTEAAANALLKTLEEPGKATIILIAPPRSLLPTIVSRTQQIPFYPLSSTDLRIVLERVGRKEILEHPEILDLANGSPGLAITSYEQLQAISPELLNLLKQFPQTPLQALQLAKEINEQLDTTAGLWLVDYLQYYYWDRYRQESAVRQLEKTRQYLLAYVQPRLVWESTLLAFC